MNIRKYIILLFVNVIASCSSISKSYWHNETSKVEECWSKLIYKDLEEKQNIKVLLFNAKMNYDISSYPIFIIGVTETNDTIGFIDKIYNKKINLGDTLKLLPSNWSEEEKNTYKPLFTVRNKSDENDLYCKITKVYYGKIE